VQGFSGGTLIPLVFSAVFLLFPVRLQAGCRRLDYRDVFMALLFLINVLPGAVAALAASVTLPNEQASFDEARHLDVISLALGATALAALEIAIKEAPKQRRRNRPHLSTNGTLARDVGLIDDNRSGSETRRGLQVLLELKT
jgi:hypothetical protein